MNDRDTDFAEIGLSKDTDEALIDRRAASIHDDRRRTYHSRIDRVFACLFMLQWPVAVLLAWYMTPRTWVGTDSSVHLHLYLAVLLGGLATILPVWLAFKRPGDLVTRHVIAASTMLFTALFIHLSGGRDEGHFHFFMMMAFVALYFDWKVILTAIAVGALDHIIRTAFFPMSVFGVLASPWFQLFRHVLWVVFEGSVLVYAALSINRDWRKAAYVTAVGEEREQQVKELLDATRQHAELEREASQRAAEADEKQRDADAEARRVAEAAQESERKRAELLNRQVTELLITLDAAAAGDLGQPVTVKGDDPVGQLGRGLEQLLARLSQSFTSLARSSTMLTVSSSSLSRTSGLLGESVRDTSLQAERISGATTEISSNVEDVAAGTEEMNAVMTNIAESSRDAVSVGQSAVVLAQQADTTVRQLGESSTGIGNVLKVITTIAEQTNLLALNATIEAARAGDAGKGFAVVANEVKELAQETARATEEIGSRIGAIQRDADSAGTVIAQIGEIIGQIEGYQQGIASAVEEQTGTTREMSRRVSETARGSSEIAEAIAGLADQTRKTRAGADETEQTARQLNAIALELQSLVDEFSSPESDGSTSPLARAA